jgi:hypothetical protein
MEPTQRFESATCEGIELAGDGFQWRTVHIQIRTDVTLGHPVADARLISSAPEIHQALESLVDLLETTDLRHTGRTLAVAQERIQKALELLAYIKGEL